MMLHLLLYLGFALSGMGVAIKSVDSRMYLNLKTLKLEPVDKKRKKDYILGYEWSGGAPYGFGLRTGEGYLTVDEKLRRLSLRKGDSQGGNGKKGGSGTSSSNGSGDFGFHFVTPVKCKNVVIGHNTGLCMMDGGKGEIEFSDCLPPGEESSKFHFIVKVFKRFPVYSGDGTGGGRGNDTNTQSQPITGIEELVDRIVDDIKRSENPDMSTEAIRELVKSLLKSIRNPSDEVKKKGDNKDVPDETEEETEEGCREYGEPDDETEDKSEPGCYASAEEDSDRGKSKDLNKKAESESFEGGRKRRRRRSEDSEEGNYPPARSQQQYQPPQQYLPPQQYQPPQQHQQYQPPQQYQPNMPIRIKKPSFKKLSERFMDDFVNEVLPMPNRNAGPDPNSFSYNGYHPQNE